MEKHCYLLFFYSLQFVKFPFLAGFFEQEKTLLKLAFRSQLINFLKNILKKLTCIEINMHIL